MIQGKNGLILVLRYDGYFNEEMFEDIKKYIEDNFPKWKEDDFIPLSDSLAIFDLIFYLGLKNEFWSEETQNLARDAQIEIAEMMIELGERK